MATFKLINGRRARDEDDESGFWLVASGRPVPVRRCSRHQVTVANQSLWPSAIADAVCEIRYSSQAHNCLIFGSSDPQHLAIMPSRVLRKRSPVVKYFDMLRRPPGGCTVTILTTVAVKIDDPMLQPSDPDPAVKIVAKYGITVR
jgi:hypothetical protein